MSSKVDRTAVYYKPLDYRTGKGIKRKFRGVYHDVGKGPKVGDEFEYDTRTHNEDNNSRRRFARRRISWDIPDGSKILAVHVFGRNYSEVWIGEFKGYGVVKDKESPTGIRPLFDSKWSAAAWACERLKEEIEAGNG